LAFIQSLNVGLDTPRESLLLIVDLYKKANQKAIDKARLYREHVAETGNPNKFISKRSKTYGANFYNTWSWRKIKRT